MPIESRPHASVVVCTRNRSTDLTATLTGLLELDHAPEGWELVIVDNASTDDTAEVASAFARNHPERVRVVEERELGLSAARNAGIRAARGEVIAFLDDDAIPEATWLTALVDALGREDVLVAGGAVIPAFQGELPPWFAGRLLPYLSIWDKGDAPVPLVYNEYPRGTNIAFRREAFTRFGSFSTRLGRKGRSLLSGEEIELCLRIERGGGRILFVPGASVRHTTPAERITPPWMMLRFQAQGRTEAIINWRHGGFGGLRAGLGLHLRNVFAARLERRFGETGEVMAACQRRALRGYLRGMVEAPFTVRRFRAPRGQALAPWRPIPGAPAE